MLFFLLWTGQVYINCHSDRLYYYVPRIVLLGRRNAGGESWESCTEAVKWHPICEKTPEMLRYALITGQQSGLYQMGSCEGLPQATTHLLLTETSSPR